MGIVGRNKSRYYDDLCGGTPAVPTTICVANVFTLARGALGV